MGAGPHVIVSEQRRGQEDAPASVRPAALVTAAGAAAAAVPIAYDRPGVLVALDTAVALLALLAGAALLAACGRDRAGIALAAAVAVLAVGAATLRVLPGAAAAGMAAAGIVGLAAARRGHLGAAATRWPAAALVLLTAAAAVRLVLPGWGHVADGLRAAFAAAALVGAARLLRDRWRRLDVARERRRIARDLHDGVVQELAYIRRRAPRLRAAGDRDVADEVIAAADRAATEARRAVDGLRARTGSLRETLGAEARRAAGGDLALQLRLAPGLDVAPPVHDALARIVGEAVANAAQHARAECVRVELDGDPGLRLRVVDDGIGFTAPTRGFGLMSMRERAEEVGAAFEVRSRPGTGTEVRVRLG